MSRLELCKSTNNDPSDPILTEQWPVVAKQLYDLIADRLNDFYSIPSLKTSSPKLGGFDGGDFYVWQFMALVALNVDADAKKAMIVELRDKIMSIVEHGSQKNLSHLNLFLNVLGLDSSQLSVN